MVSEERLRQWVKDKMEEGISEERIKNSLEETGHDPSIVEEVQNPFENGESHEAEVDLSRDEQEGDGEMEAPSGSEHEYTRPDPGEVESPERSGEDSSKLDSLDLPDVARRQVLSGAAVLLLIFGALAAFSYGLPEIQLPEVEQQEQPQQTDEVSTSPSASPASNCDVGVRINYIRSEGGSTSVKASVLGGAANTTLRLFNQGELVGSRNAQFSGSRVFSFEETGYSAVFQPVGCGFEDRLSVG